MFASAIARERTLANSEPRGSGSPYGPHVPYESHRMSHVEVSSFAVIVEKLSLRLIFIAQGIDENLLTTKIYSSVCSMPKVIPGRITV